MASLNYKLAALEKACLGTGILVEHNYSAMYLIMQRPETNFKLNISYQFIDHFTGKWTFFVDLFMEKENSFLNEMYFVKKYTTEQQMNAATKLIEDIYKAKAPKPNYQPSNVGYANSLSRIVPSMHSETECPGDMKCDCSQDDCAYRSSGCDRKDSVWGMIQHLNDSHMWTREKIADWIDDLQDNHGYNFTIESPNMDRS